MRKKFIAVYALMAVLALGSTTLTSCVDDNESASVTAIRNAKAEQLKALAALSNAQAEAAKIQAEAEAALKNAQAEWKKEQTEEAKQKFAIKIEVIKAQAERDIAEAKKQALEYEKQIWDNADAKIQAMVSDYQTALNKVISTKEELIEAKIDYAHFEVDSTLAEAKYKEFVIDQNRTIAQNEADIKRLQALAEGGADKTALAEQMEVLAGQAYKMLHTDLPAVEAKQAEAKKAKEDAYLPINIDKPFTEDQEHEKLEWEAGLLPYAKGVQTLKAYEAEYSDEDIKFIEADNETYVASIKECFEEEAVTVYTRSKGSDFVKATQVVENALNQDIADATANLGAKKTATEAGTGALGDLEQAEADLKAKQAALAAENAKPDKDQSVINQLEGEIDDLNVSIEQYKESVAQYTEEIADLKQELKDFQATLEVVKEGSDAQKQYIETAKTVLKAAEAYVTAQHEVHKVDNAIKLIGLSKNNFNDNMEVNANVQGTNGSQYNQLYELYSNTADVEELIAECEKNIAEAKKAIERGESSSNGYHLEEKWVDVAVYDDYGNFTRWEQKRVLIKVYDYVDERFTETTRAMMEENIKRLEEELAVYEQIANNYKAALDAAIQASDSDVNVPETPEEGGEETPAE
ncbi:hypothetical protein [Phocaeicola coprophilus]|jgi:chromosome segregation ATPase|uniref:hypothetical protein n=1 Tax=Phocaeicola coprophilus TaxID=387090 RepID=UPI003AF18518